MANAAAAMTELKDRRLMKRESHSGPLYAKRRVILLRQTVRPAVASAEDVLGVAYRERSSVFTHQFVIEAHHARIRLADGCTDRHLFIVVRGSTEAAVHLGHHQQDAVDLDVA